MLGDQAWQALLAALLLAPLATLALLARQWHSRAVVLHRQAGCMLRDARVALAKAHAVHGEAQRELRHHLQHWGGA